MASKSPWESVYFYDEDSGEVLEEHIIPLFGRKHVEANDCWCWPTPRDYAEWPVWEHNQEQ